MFFPKNFQRPKISPGKNNGKTLAPQKSLNKQNVTAGVKNKKPLLLKEIGGYVTCAEIRKIRKKLGKIAAPKKIFHDYNQ